MNRLSRDFYLQTDVLDIAKKLLGKVLVSQIGGQRTSGIIVETEAYQAPEDKASHAYNFKRTKRTETMYNPGGHAYIYLCYGLHHLFNVVTGLKGMPHAVLVRALQPLENIPGMLSRRKNKHPLKVTKGPALLSEALAITVDMDGTDLVTSQLLWIENYLQPEPGEIQQSKRIGVEYAQECASWEWRFYLKNNSWVSQ